MPTEFVKPTVEAVPRPRRAFDVVGEALMSFIASKTRRPNSSGSAHCTAPVPRTTMALTFFDPITAPTPERPAARDLSLMTQATRFKFSPAGPMPERSEEHTSELQSPMYLVCRLLL